MDIINDAKKIFVPESWDVCFQVGPVAAICHQLVAGLRQVHLHSAQHNKTVEIRTSVLGIFKTDLKSIISLEQFSIPVVKFSLSEMLHKDLIVESHSERLKSSFAP